MQDSGLDILIPVSIELDDPTRDEVVACVREQNRRYGFRRFLLAAPSGGWRSIGYPPREAWEHRARLFREVRDELERDGIECGWYITTTLKSGASPLFTQMVKASGESSFFANCPADPAFRRRFSADVAAFAQIARPALIITEDDYSIHAGSGEKGCFCEYHLAAFERMTGKRYTREELVSALAEKSTAAFELLRQWRSLMRDTLVELAREIRAAVDERNPEIPIGAMQSGHADSDGDTTLEICRALAGKRHKPFARLFGTFYCGGSARDLPEVLYHALYSRQHSEELVAYHETDTFPHTRFFLSGAVVRAMMSIVYSEGFVGSVFQTQQLLDDPNEEEIYGKIFAGERPRLEAIRRAALQCRMRGVEICYDPFWNSTDLCAGMREPLWARPVGLFGIPYVTTSAEVAFWDVRQAKHADDSTVLAYLSRGLILDGAAARVLSARGFGKYLGVEVGDDVCTAPLQYDLAAREVLCDGVLPEQKGRHMPSAHMYATGNNGQLLRLSACDGRCEVLSELRDFTGNCITPAMTRFKNELGGRVAVMGMTLYNPPKKKRNLSQSLYNYRRQRLFAELVDWCGGQYVTVLDAANLFLVMNEAKHPDEAGFRIMLTLVNLGEDMLEQIDLRLPSSLLDLMSLEAIERDGVKARVKYELSGNRLSDLLASTLKVFFPSKN